MSLYTDLPPGWAVRDGAGYRTTAPLVWEVGRKGSGMVYYVHAGTWFDVSVPRGLRWLVDPHDRRLRKAAALHDHMLASGWDRLTAGATFAEALRADGAGPAMRLAMWLAVSLWRWR
ncbi:MAG: DUF1353 domain-containing protein [Paracoccaceae bacterium]